MYKLPYIYIYIYRYNNSTSNKYPYVIKDLHKLTNNNIVINFNNK